MIGDARVVKSVLMTHMSTIDYCAWTTAAGVGIYVALKHRVEYTWWLMDAEAKMRQMRLLLPARDAPHHRMLYFVHLHPQCNYAVTCHSTQQRVGLVRHFLCTWGSDAEPGRCLSTRTRGFTAQPEPWSCQRLSVYTQ